MNNRFDNISDNISNIQKYLLHCCKHLSQIHLKTRTKTKALKINISLWFPLTARCVTHTIHMEIYHCHDVYMPTVIIISNVALSSRKLDEC